METKTHQSNGITVLEISPNEMLINTARDLLDGRSIEITYPRGRPQVHPTMLGPDNLRLQVKLDVGLPHSSIELQKLE